MDGLARNLARVQSRIESACRAAGRDPSEVQLVCVTKTCSTEVAARLTDLGAGHLGENRVPELARKHEAFEHRGLRTTWHFLGHVQRNKARRVVQLSDVIHSVDSERLLETLERVAQEESRRPALYLQVKLTGEEAKTGLAPAEVPELVERCRSTGALPLLGLMAMAPGGATSEAQAAEQARRTFDTLAKLAHDLPADAFVEERCGLSMGMSGDLEQAVACGATVVRVGSALFEGVAPESSESSDGGKPAPRPDPRPDSRNEEVSG